jgi:hypothetical protein
LTQFCRHFFNAFKFFFVGVFGDSNTFAKTALQVL